MQRAKEKQDQNASSVERPETSSTRFAALMNQCESDAEHQREHAQEFVVAESANGEQRHRVRRAQPLAAQGRLDRFDRQCEVRYVLGQNSKQRHAAQKIQEAKAFSARDRACGRSVRGAGDSYIDMDPFVGHRRDCTFVMAAFASETLIVVATDILMCV